MEAGVRTGEWEGGNRCVDELVRMGKGRKVMRGSGCVRSGILRPTLPNIAHFTT